MESCTSEFWEVNAASCLDELKKRNNWEKIPLLNTTPSHLLEEGHLVRFRGMIQDMLNPEYYLASYEVLNTITSERCTRSGKYKDSLQCADHEKVLFESEVCVNQERRPVYCISVPAVNQWAQYKEIDSLSRGNAYNEQPGGSGIKRSLEDISDNSSRVSSIGDAAKRVCASNVSMETDGNQRGREDLHLPIPDSQARACIINVYDVEDGQLKVNDVVEVAGFLSYDPALLPSGDNMEQLPPPSLVPRLHAVTVRPVTSCNPLVTPHISLDDVMSDSRRLKGELKLLLTQLLLGDALAAEYLICHLLSRIYLRQDLLVLGKFSLNLSCMPHELPSYTTQLYDFLKQLLVKSHFLPMTLENMNTISMIPKKNYESNRLESGLLQLSDQTHLVLDETQLQPGRLNDRGVRNCRALGAVITNQRLEYDFQFYPVEFHTDIPVLILSEGKSMLPSDCHLPLKPDVDLSTVAEVFTAATYYLREPLLSQLRVYLSLISTADYDLTEDVQKIIQEDFVRMRQDEPKTSAQDLHSLLVLAKLLSLSEGAKSLTLECWETARQMERLRKQRLSDSSHH